MLRVRLLPLHRFVQRVFSLPELWRLVAGFIDEEIYKDLVDIVSNGSGIFREAALKSLTESSFGLAVQWTNKSTIKSVSKTWDEIGREWENQAS